MAVPTRTVNIPKPGGFVAVCGWKQRVKAVSQVVARRSQHGVMFCSHILFSSATVAFRTIFLSLADFKSDLS